MSAESTDQRLTIEDALEQAGIPRSAIFNSGNALILILPERDQITVTEGAGQMTLECVRWSRRYVLRFTREQARQLGAFLLSWGYKK